MPAWSDINPRLGASYDLFWQRPHRDQGVVRPVCWEVRSRACRRRQPDRDLGEQSPPKLERRRRRFRAGLRLEQFRPERRMRAIDNANFGQGDPDAVTYADNLISGYGNRDYFWDLGRRAATRAKPGVSLLVWLLSQLDRPLRLRRSWVEWRLRDRPPRQPGGDP